MLHTQQSVACGTVLSGWGPFMRFGLLAGSGSLGWALQLNPVRSLGLSALIPSLMY